MPLNLHPMVLAARLNDLMIAAHDDLVRGVRMGESCAVHIHDEWVPMVSHHVWPLGLGGPDKIANRVEVCTNAHYAIHAYFDHLITYGEGVGDGYDDVPLAIKKHFGPKVRNLARSGWVQAGQPRRGRSLPGASGDPH